MLRFFAAMAVLAAALLAAPAPEPAAAGDEPIAQSQAFSDDTLYRFAKAAINVRNVFSRNADALKSAQGKQEKKAIEEKMRTEIHDAVDNAGITVEQYRKVNEAMSENPKLRQRILQLVEKMRGSS